MKQITILIAALCLASCGSKQSLWKRSYEASKYSNQLNLGGSHELSERHVLNYEMFFRLTEDDMKMVWTKAAVVDKQTHDTTKVEVENLQYHLFSNPKVVCAGLFETEFQSERYIVHFMYDERTYFNAKYKKFQETGGCYKMSELEEPKKPSKTDFQVYGKIYEFYSNYVFGTKAVTDKVIRRYCTEKLAKRLKEAYDYDGEGYAVWEFRSDAQDGPEESTVEGYENLGNGRYKVKYNKKGAKYNEMGTRGSCIITVVNDGNKILFDEIEKVIKKLPPLQPTLPEVK